MVSPGALALVIANPGALPPPYGVASGQRSTNLLERSLKLLVVGLEEVGGQGIGRFPGHASCLSLRWAVLDRPVASVTDRVAHEERAATSHADEEADERCPALARWRAGLWRLSPDCPRDQRPGLREPTPGCAAVRRPRPPVRAALDGPLHARAPSLLLVGTGRSPAGPVARIGPSGSCWRGSCCCRSTARPAPGRAPRRRLTRSAAENRGPQRRACSA